MHTSAPAPPRGLIHPFRLSNVSPPTPGAQGEDGGTHDLAAIADALVYDDHHAQPIDATEEGLESARVTVVVVVDDCVNHVTSEPCFPPLTQLVKSHQQNPSQTQPAAAKDDPQLVEKAPLGDLNILPTLSTARSRPASMILIARFRSPRLSRVEAVYDDPTGQSPPATPEKVRRTTNGTSAGAASRKPRPDTATPAECRPSLESESARRRDRVMQHRPTFHSDLPLKSFPLYLRMLPARPLPPQPRRRRWKSVCQLRCPTGTTVTVFQPVCVSSVASCAA
ncbi:hypothetical protein MKEN_01016200 [Mycena kentingensis (nom. inval.)]|nr:hypothetical protein MKEN_01016200 [Mycena kentingensis (nom. inval.)]